MKISSPRPWTASENPFTRKSKHTLIGEARNYKKKKPKAQAQPGAAIRFGLHVSQNLF